MKNRLLLLITIFLSSATFAQDKIIKSKVEFKIIKCSKIVLSGNIVTYKAINSEEEFTISQNRISEIRLSNLNEIVVPEIRFDTIYCKITAIDENYIFYQTTNTFTNSAEEIAEVYACFFEGNTSNSKNSEFEQIERNSIAALGTTFNQKILANDHRIINSRVLSIDDQNVWFEYISETGTKIKTLLKRSDISSILYCEKYRGLKRSGLYVLTAQGYFRNCNALKISDNELMATVSTSNASLIETSIKKSDMCGLFFTDYTKTKESEPNKQSSYGGFRKANMNFSFAYAMLLASLASDSPELEKYYEDLRSGFAIAANFSIYTSDKFGTGPFVKSFLTSNSASSLNLTTSSGVIDQTSDRINCMLFAWNVVFRQRFNNYLNNEFNLAPGYFYFHNNTSVNSDHFTITGHSFGLNLSNRINFTDEDQGIFIDLSVFLGAMKKYRIKGFKFESEKTDNYSRVEIGIGLKF